MLATVVVVAEEEEEDWTEDAGGVVPVSFDSKYRDSSLLARATTSS